MKLRLEHIARVEGEAAVEFEVRDGRLIDLKVNIWEPPRFFEGFLVGRRLEEVPDIVARICGICPVSHMTTAIRALEGALGLEPSPQAVRLRRIMALSQIVASHLVHLYMLVLPDHHGLGSVAEMLPEQREKVARLLRMKRVLNGITAAFGGGRALHPVAMVVAGFTSVPSRQTVGGLLRQLQDIKEDARETLAMTASLACPEHTNSAEYAAITDAGRYALNRGRLVSSGGIDVTEDEYAGVVHEEQVPYSNAKRTQLRGGGSLMVGALARLNLKGDMLHEDARRGAQEVGFTLPSDNPFHNNLAQAVEVVHGISELAELLDGLGPERPWVDIRLREGQGAALTEAPRGLLYHSYRVNRRGVVEWANIVTPTAHNYMSLEENLRKLVEAHIDEPREELLLRCGMLVRAYDPCFSCSVH